MKNSMNPLSKTVFNSQHETTLIGRHDELPEESTWTMYFEGFFTTNNDGGHPDDMNAEEDSHCNRYASSSLIPDAASFMVVKQIISRDERFISKKKRSMKEAKWVDDDLQDTASSPSNSPKEKGVGSSNGDDSNGRPDGDTTGLKKRGLCLVPLSMVAKYLA